jgi:hypothetical protein
LLKEPVEIGKGKVLGEKIRGKVETIQKKGNAVRMRRIAADK